MKSENDVIREWQVITCVDIPMGKVPSHLDEALTFHETKQTG